MLTKSLFCSLWKRSSPLSFYTPPLHSSRVHIDVVVFAIGSLDQTHTRAFFGVCPELFRQDPVVSAKSTFGHASIPKRLEDVLRTGNQFSDHFFSQFGGRQGSHTSLLGTTTTRTIDSCLGGSSSSSGAFLRHDGMVGLVSFVCFYVFLKCIVTMVLPDPNLVRSPLVSATLMSTMSTTSLRRGMY